MAVLFQTYQKEKKNEKNEIILISTSRQLWRLQTVGKVYLLNKLMYIYENYTSTNFYVNINCKEKHAFDEFDKSGLTEL